MRANALTQHLPRYDISVVLHQGNDNVIPGMHLSVTPTVGDEVNPLGGAAHKHQLFRRSRIEEGSHLGAHVLHALGGFRAQGMDPPMYCCITVAVEIGFRIHHLIRFLRAGRAVEISQRQTVHFTGQNREICPYFLYGKTHASPPGRR